MSRVGIGENYIDHCKISDKEKKISIEERESSENAEKGIVEVLSGVRERFDMEYLCSSPETDYWYQMVVLPFKGEKGGLVISHSDITLRKKLEANLVDAERHYRTVADYTYDWEYWEAADGSLEYVSPSCERISGYSVSDYYQSPQLLTDIILPEDKTNWDAHEHGVPVNEEVTSTHFRILTKNGNIKWIAHVCQPVYSDTGEYLGVRASNRDITYFRETEKKIRRQSDLLMQLERRQNLGQMAASIAHELNQPLTGILSDAQAGELLLKEKHVNIAEIKSILSDIVSDTKRASMVMRNLRELFTGDQSNSYDTFDVNELILDTLKLLNIELLNRGITCRKHLSNELYAIEANRIQIQQVLINLLRNAWQALELSTKVDLRITITTTPRDHGRIAITVEDNGPGIDPKIADQIYEPLATTKNDGMGMGLAISRSIIKSHGGNLGLEYTSNDGTAFVLTLPMRALRHE